MLLPILSDSANRKVDLVIARAENDYLDANKCVHDPTGFDPDRPDRGYRIAKALDFLETVFGGVATLIIDSQELSVREIREKLDGFKRELEAHVFSCKWPLLSVSVRQPAISDLEDYLDYRIESQTAWRVAQKWILEIAEYEASEKQEPGIALPRQSVKQLLEEFKQKNFPRISKDAFALKMNIERSVFYDLQAGRPVSGETYEKVSRFTGIPFDLLKCTPTKPTD